MLSMQLKRKTSSKNNEVYYLLKLFNSPPKTEHFVRDSAL